MAEQRYKAVMAVVGDGRSVTEVAASWGVPRQTLHTWLARYESGGLENLVDRSHRPASCPHQVDPDVEVAIWEMRRADPGWGPTRLVFELGRRGVVVSRSGVYRALRRAGLIDPRPVDAARSTGAVGSGAGRWSCGRWTSWAGSRWWTARARST